MCRQLGGKGKRLRVERGRSMACREAPEHVRRAEGGSMRGGQGEIYRGDCADSRAVMPYNSDATRTKISDSSVG